MREYQIKIILVKGVIFILNLKRFKNILNILICMSGSEVVIVEGKLKKIVHLEGSGETPKKGQEIFALYRGTLENGDQFDSNQNRDSPFNFVLGQGNVIKGWDEGFATMKIGEKATLICSPQYAYGANGSPPRIPANATLHFEVELLDFKDKKKESWQYSDEQKISEGTKFKVSGNQKLKGSNYKGAVSDYKEGIDLLENESNGEAKQLLNILRLNISQAYLKLNKNSEVIDNCTKVLKQQQDNLKALYRRGVAYSKNQQFDQSEKDFKQLLKLDPQNSEAKKQLANIAVLLRKIKEKEKKVFGNMFSKGEIYSDVKVETKIEPEVKKVESEEEEEVEEEREKEQHKIPEQEHVQKHEQNEQHQKTE